MKKISVQREDFDLGQEVSLLRSSSVGAIVTFSGLVRGESQGEKLHSMTLEHFPGMTERQLNDIVAEAETRWELTGVTVIHRVGELIPGKQIVCVVTAAAHRQAAFEACDFLMDYLKTRAPFWKCERRASGEYWIEARDSDALAAARWT